MPFTAYATPADVEAYVPSATRDLWGGDRDAVQDSLERAARRLNERFGGLDRYTTIPVEAEEDGNYAEVLVQMNVYEAIVVRVSGIQAGEAFEEYWRPFVTHWQSLWTGIVEGEYSFGSLPEETSAADKIIYLGRASI